MLLRVLRHAHHNWIVAALPLLVVVSSRVARADDNSSAAEPDDSVTSKTKTKTQTYALPPPESRWKTIGLGLGFSGVWYTGAWGLREWAWYYSPGARDLRYPFVGPWMDLYKTGCPSNDTNCGKFGLVLRTVAVVVRRPRPSWWLGSGARWAIYSYSFALQCGGQRLSSFCCPSNQFAPRPLDNNRWRWFEFSRSILSHSLHSLTGPFSYA